MVRRAESTQAGGYLTHGLRRTLRKACNRMAADGVSAEITFIYDPRSNNAPTPASANQAIRRSRRPRRNIIQETGSLLS